MARSRRLGPFLWVVLAALLRLHSVHAAGGGRRALLQQPAPGPRLLVVFGDSITDTGNTLKATNGTLPSPSVYWKGRFTNGRNWVDYLAFAVNAWSSRRVIVRNYATGAATACAPGPAYRMYSNVLRDGFNQTASYVADYKAGKIPKTTPQPLFIYWLGVNDLAEVLYSGASLTPEEVGAFVQRHTACRIAAVRTLVEQGGAKAVAVMPLGAVQETTDVPAEMKATVKQLVDVLDHAAATTLQQLQAAYASSGVKLVYLGTNSDWYLEGMDILGFKNRTAPCVNDPYALRPKAVQPKICAKPNSYLFYSQLHPTTIYHKWVSQQGIFPKLLEAGLLQ